MKRTFFVITVFVIVICVLAACIGKKHMNGSKNGGDER